MGWLELVEGINCRTPVVLLHEGGYTTKVTRGCAHCDYTKWGLHRPECSPLPSVFQEIDHAFQ